MMGVQTHALARPTFRRTSLLTWSIEPPRWREVPCMTPPRLGPMGLRVSLELPEQPVLQPIRKNAGGASVASEAQRVRQNGGCGETHGRAAHISNRSEVREAYRWTWQPQLRGPGHQQYVTTRTQKAETPHRAGSSRKSLIHPSKARSGCTELASSIPEEVRSPPSDE